MIENVLCGQAVSFKKEGPGDQRHSVCGRFCEGFRPALQGPRQVWIQHAQWRIFWNVHDTGRSFPHLTQISEWLLFAFPQGHLQQSIAKWPLPAESGSVFICARLPFFRRSPAGRTAGTARHAARHTPTPNGY